jgi:serine/threonine-protein kinase
MAHMGLAEVELYDDHPAQALVQAQGNQGRQYQLLGTALAEFSLHHPHESQQVLDELIRTEASAMAYQIAEIYAWRGEKDLAFTWLDRSYAQKDAGLPDLKVDRILAPLRTDPRFGALLRKMKLPL